MACGTPESLLGEAERFAVDLTCTVRSAFGDLVSPFQAQVAVGDSRSRVAVVQLPASGVPLTIDGNRCLQLKVEYWCLWDHAGAYLAVDEAKIKVMAVNVSEPLFRYEYLRSPGSEQPCAHLQIHGHRDALAYVMTLSGEGSPRGKRRRQAVHRREGAPRMSELHFPLGGHRYRPCLEDVLHMLVDEFGVDTVDGAMEALARGRETWRTGQLAAAVRDCPETAARVLAELKYEVRVPGSGHPRPRSDRLQAY